MLEGLENRRMFAVAAYMDFASLIVEGDNAANMISVVKSGSMLRVNVYASWGGSGTTIFETNMNQGLGVAEIRMRGGGGNDVLSIGNSITLPATVWGGAGEDYIVGGGGYTYLYGHGNGLLGSGHDIASDDASADTIVSGSGETDLFGQDGHDELYTDNYGTSGADFLHGGDGFDHFYTRGHDGTAYVYGGEGHDTLVPYQSATQEVVFEGGSYSYDTVNYMAWTQPVYVKPDGSTPSGLRYGTRLHKIDTDVELIYGTDYDDYFSGTDENNGFYGIGGDNLMYGHGGNDTLSGHEGDDTLYGGAGEDELSGALGNDLIYGGSGDDEIQGGWDDDVLYGESGADTIVGDDGSDVLVGGSGSDYLNSYDGVLFNDLVYGGNIDGTGNGGYVDVALVDRIWVYPSFVGDGVSGVEQFDV